MKQLPVKLFKKSEQYQGFDGQGWYFIDEYRKKIYGPYREEKDAKSESEIHVITSNIDKQEFNNE